VTSTILDDIRQRSGSAAVIAFDVDTVAPYHDALVELILENGIEYVPVAEALQKATEKGLRATVVPNGHWNAIGHRVCAQVLEDYIRKRQKMEARTEHTSTFQ